MTRTCTVCHHRRVALIDDALVKGVPYRTISQDYELSEFAIGRHKREHLPALIAKAHEAKETARADDLLREIGTIKKYLLHLSKRADNTGDLRTAIQGCTAALKSLELSAKVSQVIQTQPQINVHLHPEWVELRAVIIRALDQHPEAKEDVRLAIATVTGSGA